MAAGSHLWFAVYDLPSDTWYGPLDEFWCAVVTPSGGLWRGGSDGLRYLSLDDVMAYAEATGRAMTTAQYRQRREQFIAAAKPLDRGKFALAMRQFDRAKAALQEVLQAEPDQPEALRLMGFLYDANCLNQPDEAMKYYRRLAAVEGDPSATFSGMRLCLAMFIARGQWQDAAALSQAILEQFPDLYEWDQKFVEGCRDQSRQKLAQPRKGKDP